MNDLDDYGGAGESEMTTPFWVPCNHILVGDLVDLQQSYVYVYKDRCGKIRYVGKGTDDRAESHLKSCRSKRHEEYNSDFHRWLRRVRKYTIEYPYSNLSHEEAYQREIDLILSIGLDNLFNKAAVKGHAPLAKPIIKILFSFWSNQHRSGFVYRGAPKMYQSPRHAEYFGGCSSRNNASNAANEGNIHSDGFWMWAMYPGRLTEWLRREECAEAITKFYHPDARKRIKKWMFGGIYAALVPR